MRMSREISEVTLSINEVRDCLSNLDPSKATGPNGIPAHIIKECSEKIALSICALSIILYILGGLRQIGSQLMLLQFLKEIFWSQLKIVDLSHHFQLWAKLWNAASVTGFIATSRSQLLLYNTNSCVPVCVLRNFLERHLTKNKQTDILYFDFATAFNTVDLVILFEKLKRYGVIGQLRDWYSEYLKDRSRRVVVDGTASEHLPVSSVVAQGSLVGLLLFVIFINAWIC